MNALGRSPHTYAAALCLGLAGANLIRGSTPVALCLCAGIVLAIPGREARPTGLGEALSDPAVHLHLYDKRRVFERRKMGHVAALGPDVESALAQARHAASAFGWADAE